MPFYRDAALFSRPPITRHATADEQADYLSEHDIIDAAPIP
jgi:hypothetical protein